MRAVEEYLKQLHENIARQVYIDVKIMEVSLSSDRSLGIDWSKIDMGALTLSGVTGFSTSAGGNAVPPATLQADYNKTFPRSFVVNNLQAVVKALRDQGDVKVVSQPRIRTLNNQSAIVRSGTERTFFTTQTVLTPVAGGTPVVTTTNTPTTVTEGLVLSLTPQISPNGRIAMDISPVITRISGVDLSPDGRSNAPRLDVKQTSTMVRVGDGETVIIGGLIQEEEEETNRSVPGLGEVPGVRHLFGTTYKAASRRELVVILTPYIVQ
jgi:MSHA type pilus biogenesis protein MshL